MTAVTTNATQPHASNDAAVHVSPSVALKRSLLLAGLALAVYALAVPSGFVFDDSVAIESNPVVTGEVPWFEAVSRDFWGRTSIASVKTYRPLPVLGFVLDRQLGGGAAWVFHLVNVLLHAAIVVLLYRVWRGLVSERVAFAAAALFAVLSPPAEAVQSIVGRADLLAALFGLLGLSAHLRASRSEASGRKSGARATAAASLFLLGALASKESAIAFPAAWLLVEWWRDKRIHLPFGRLSAYAAMAGVYLTARAHALGDAFATRVGDLTNPLVTGTAFEAFLGAGETFWARYLRVIVDPGYHLYLCSAPACGPRGPESIGAWLGLAAMAALVVTAIVCIRRAPIVSLGLGWFLVLFLPISNLLVVGPALYAERLLYVPLMGVVVLAAAGTDALSRRIRPQVAWGLFAALAVTHAAALQVRHQEWRSDASLFLSALEVEPDSSVVQANAAGTLLELGDAEGALTHASRAIELEPEHGSAWKYKAMALDLLDREEEAKPVWEEAFRRVRTVDVAMNYAIFLANQGDLSRALDVLQTHPFRHHGNESWRELESRLAADLAEESRDEAAEELEASSGSTLQH